MIDKNRIFKWKNKPIDTYNEWVYGQDGYRDTLRQYMGMQALFPSSWQLSSIQLLHKEQYTPNLTQIDETGT